MGSAVFPPCGLTWRPNYGGGNEDSSDLLQKIPCIHCCTQCPRPCSRPPPTHTSTGDSWTLPGKSRSVSCGVAAPFSWVLLCTRFCLGLARVYFPVLCKFWQLYGGVNGNLLQEGLCRTQVCYTRIPCPCSSPLLTLTSTGEISGVTGKFGLGEQNEAGQRLTELCQENALVIANTLFQKHKRRLYTWTSPDGQHQNQTDYLLSSQRLRSSIQSETTRPGADCGSHCEFFIAQFRLKLKKEGKATRPFRYDINQIPYDYTVEVTNRLKGLDLIESLKNFRRRFVTL